MSFFPGHRFSFRRFSIARSVAHRLWFVFFFVQTATIFGDDGYSQLQITQDGRQVMYVSADQDAFFDQTTPDRPTTIKIASQTSYLPQNDIVEYEPPYIYQDSGYGYKNPPKKRSVFSLFSFDFLWSPKNDEVRFRESGRNTAEERPRMLQGASISTTYIPGLGSRGFEMAQLRVGATMGLPGIGENCFIMLSPSFEPTLVDWDGPEPFPDTFYNASLSCTMIKQFNERWGGMISVAPRWCSDGRETKDAVRCPIMGGFIWNKSPRLQIRFGIAYLDRDDDLNVMPFGGLVWKPNDDWKFELMAPQLRVARRWDYFRSILPGEHDSTHWGYVGIGFGGGTWAFESIGNRADVADYKEYSVVIGLESERSRRVSWKAEFGYIFGRKIKFENHTMRKFDIDDSLVFRLSLSI